MGIRLYEYENDDASPVAGLLGANTCIGALRGTDEVGAYWDGSRLSESAIVLKERPHEAITIDGRTECMRFFQSGGSSIDVKVSTARPMTHGKQQKL